MKKKVRHRVNIYKFPHVKCVLLPTLILSLSISAARAQSIASSKAEDEGFFITIWQTDNDGASDEDQIIIPGEGNGYTIDWENVDDPDLSGSETGSDRHTVTFPESGTYRVIISGDFSRINFGQHYIVDDGDNRKIVDVEQWGNIEWSTMLDAFRMASNLDISATDAPDLSKVSSMRNMFREAGSMNGNIGHWDVSNVTDMAGMFRGAGSFNQDISGWEVSKVTDMSAMFLRALRFDQDIGGWDVSNVTDMHWMFWNASMFNSDLGNWDVSNVTDMEAMFWGALSFNQNIGDWDTGDVTNMSRMFRQATSFNQNIGDWNVSNVTDMSHMFRRAGSFNRRISDWDVSNVTDMSRIFRRAGSFNQDISEWETGEVTDMTGMFSAARSFDQNLGSWDVSNTEWMDEMLDETDISVANYDSTLIGWSSRMLQQDVTLGASGLYYCYAEEQRQHIIDNFNWNIIDEGKDCQAIYAENQELVPDDFALGQSYPNPFNPVTRIPFDLPEHSDVRLEVYNMLGQRVTVLADRIFDAGRHKVSWDASAASSGVYLVRLTVTREQGRHKQFTRQITLIK